MWDLCLNCFLWSWESCNYLVHGPLWKYLDKGLRQAHRSLVDLLLPPAAAKPCPWCPCAAPARTWPSMSLLGEPAGPSWAGGTPLRQLPPQLLRFGARWHHPARPTWCNWPLSKRSAPAESSCPAHALHLQRLLPLLWFYQQGNIYLKNNNKEPWQSSTDIQNQFDKLKWPEDA